MIDTLGPRGHRGGARRTVASCAAFTAGALPGGVITFGGLALLGSLAGSGGALATAAACALLAAALLEARGAPIIPQIRRQVPEPWRRVAPLPVAAAGYGLLLGMGFTTYVLTFAVPALAAACLALGDPLAGLVVGLAFGTGRAVPIVLLAPAADSRWGRRAIDLMLERPAILRGFRAADAVALTVCAAVLGAEGTQALAAVALMAPSGTDPSVQGSELAWQTPGGTGRLQRGDAAPVDAGGTHPALGGGHLAIRIDAAVRVLHSGNGQEVVTVPDAGSGAVAVSERWLIVRIGDDRGDRLEAIALDGRGRFEIARVRAPAQLGRPAIDGDRVVFHVAGRTKSELREIDLRTGAPRTLRRAEEGVVLNPSLLGNRLLYVSSTATRQQLLIGRTDGERDHALYGMVPTARRDSGHAPGRGRHRAGYPRKRPPRLCGTTPAGGDAHAVDDRTRRAARVHGAVATPP